MDERTQKPGTGSMTDVGARTGAQAAAPATPDDLDRVLAARHALTDAARPEAAARQARRGRLTARAALDRLADPGSFVEYGGLVRSALEDPGTPADGLIMGTAKVAGRPVAVVFYDYTVQGGSQSYMNHHKISRMFAHAKAMRLPVVCWLDGGGARPQDGAPGRRLAPETFVLFAQLSGRVPTVCVVPSRAFAGHANLAGMCDCLIAVSGSAIGIGGPPLVEAATGQRLTPEEIGPYEVHRATGVIDIAVETDEEAVDTAQRYLAYFSGPASVVEAPEVAKLRGLVPENPRRAYDVRRVIQHIVDQDSMTELRREFGKAVVTALARLNGRTVGVVANQPMIQAGAIDSPAGDKAARFTQLCDAFDIPVLLLCDTPGILVGPEAEATGIVRHGSRLLMALANAEVPIMSVVLRKAFGLGFYIMGSQALRPAILLAWPGAQYGGMGIEGAVAIMHGRELAAIADPEERDRQRQAHIAAMRHAGSALETAARFLYDDVIDPADTRRILTLTMETFPAPDPQRPRRYIDAI